MIDIPNFPDFGKEESNLTSERINEKLLRAKRLLSENKIRKDPVASVPIDFSDVWAREKELNAPKPPPTNPKEQQGIRPNKNMRRVTSLKPIPFETSATPINKKLAIPVSEKMKKTKAKTVRFGKDTVTEFIRGSNEMRGNIKKYEYEDDDVVELPRIEFQDESESTEVPIGLGDYDFGGQNQAVATEEEETENLRQRLFRLTAIASDILHVEFDYLEQDISDDGRRTRGKNHQRPLLPYKFYSERKL